MEWFRRGVICSNTMPCPRGLASREVAKHNLKKHDHDDHDEENGEIIFIGFEKDTHFGIC